MLMMFYKNLTINDGTKAYNYIVYLRRVILWREFWQLLRDYAFTLYLLVCIVVFLLVFLLLISQRVANV